MGRKRSLKKFKADPHREMGKTANDPLGAVWVGWCSSYGKGGTGQRFPSPRDPVLLSARHPSWRSEENQERSRTGSESSQSGPAAPPGTSAGSGPTGRSELGSGVAGTAQTRVSSTSHTDLCPPPATRRRESEKSLENEPLGKEEEPPSPPPKAREEKPKVMPAPPPKENAWMKRSSQNPPGNSQSSDTEQPSPTRWVSQEGAAWGQLFQPRVFHGSLVEPLPGEGGP